MSGQALKTVAAPPVQNGFEVAASLGELTVVTPPGKSTYERTLALLETTRRDIDAVTRTKGPLVPDNARDRWLATHATFPCVASLTIGVIATVASAGTMLIDKNYALGVLLAGLVAASAVAFSYVERASKRLEAAKERHDTEELNSGDVEQMLASFRKATPEERAWVAPFVKNALLPLEGNLSAKAASTRDRLLAALPKAEGANARAADLAIIVDDLLAGGQLGKHLQKIQEILVEAPPDEQRLLAERLEAATFRDETALVNGGKSEIRALYDALEQARESKA